jgi:hypothetical protein
MGRTLLLGAVLGLVGGVAFSVLYFGAGQIAAPMAYIHEVSGTILGLLIAWIVALSRKAAAK